VRARQVVRVALQHYPWKRRDSRKGNGGGSALRHCPQKRRDSKEKERKERARERKELPESSARIV